MSPRTAWGQARTIAPKWAQAEADALKLPADTLGRRTQRWTSTLHKAGLSGIGEDGGWVRGTLPIRLDLTPKEAADAVSCRHVSDWLRAGSRLLWLSVLLTTPERVRGLGRLYTPADCRFALLQVDDLLTHPRQWVWASRFLNELCWHYRLTHINTGGGFTDHAATPVLRRIGILAHRHGIPHLPARLAHLTTEQAA